MSFWTQIQRHVTLEHNPEASISDFVSSKDFKIIESLQNQVENESGCLAIIAKYGSGKTTLLRSLKTTLEREKTQVRYASFGKCHRIEDALVGQYPFSIKILSWIVLSLVFFLIGRAIEQLNSPIENIDLALLIGGQLVLGNNTFRVYSVVCGILWTFWRRKNVFVLIDEIDRSALTDGDLLTVLSSLWTYKCRCFITLGGQKDERLLELIQICSKAGIPTFKFSPEGTINFILSKVHYPKFPFNTGSWYAVAPFREIRDVINDAITTAQIEGYTYFEKIVIWKFFFEFLKDRCPDEDKQIYFFVDNGVLRIKTSAVSRFWATLFLSFSKSFEQLVKTDDPLVQEDWRLGQNPLKFEDIVANLLNIPFEEWKETVPLSQKNK